MKNGCLLITCVLLLIPFICVQTYCTIQEVRMNQGCTGHLKRAADASTVEMALSELTLATNYLEAKRVTAGSTSILWETPNNDIGYWYQNLKNSEDELRKVDHSTSQTERTNVLMKLRETVLDHGEKGDYITCPDNIEIYPSQVFIFSSWLATLLLAFAAVIVGFLVIQDL